MRRQIYRAKWQPDPNGGRILCGCCGQRVPFTRILRNEDRRFARITCDIVGFCLNDECQALNDCDEAFDRHLRPADFQDSQRGVA
ncbi:hypothetical protein QQM79_08480 [Marinobacteraceae bacterium S3BR75-40.1]